MAISDTQKVDYLWKKIGYAATKTDTTANKDATNEALPSPLQIRGDSLLVQSSSIPSTIPSTATSIVSVYRPDSTLEMPQTAIGTNGPGQRGQLGSATAYRTWQTGFQNWISPEFGATYAVRVFLDTAGRTTSNTTGTELFATTTNEEWFFDYQSGVLNFSGNNLPSGISTKSVYISGARYTGEIGIANTVNTAAAAFAHANAAFAAANNASDSWVRNQANSAFIQANAAFIVANGAAGTDVTQNNSITVALNTANAAFSAANGAVAVNTTQNNSITVALNTANAAFANANSYITYNEAVSVTQNNSIASAFVHANAAFDSANNIDGVNTTQNNSITVALNTANAAYANANSYITYNEAVNLSQNNFTAAAFVQANSGFIQANAAFANANAYITYNEAVNVTQNNNITVALNTSNAAFANANAYITYNEAVSVTQNNSIAAAFIRANNSLDANNGGTITGNVSIAGNLSIYGNVFVSGNTFSVDAGSLIANDTVLIMGTGNYFSDILDIGFASHYNNGANAHTGLIRDAGTKEWSLFKGYTPEILANNNIDINHPSFEIDTLNANLHSTTVTIKNIDILPYANGIYNTANAAFASANAINGVNTTQNNSIVAAFNTANAAFANANSYITYNEAVSVTQNNSITAAFAAANAATATDATQNNSISAAFASANAAFDTANGAVAVNLTQNNSITAAFYQANAAFASANSIDGVNTTQNNSIAAAFAAANAATATDATQNNSITVALNTANASFNKANAALANTTGTLDGSLSVTGTFTSLQSIGDEGGQIDLAKAATNTSIVTGVSIDVFQNKIRIFETGGTNRGVYIDLANDASATVNTNLLSINANISGGTF